MKWSKRESLLVRPIQYSNLDAGVFYFCHGLHGFSRKNQKGQVGNLWKSVQSVAENAVYTANVIFARLQLQRRNIQTGCSLCLRVFVVHLRELPRKKMTDTPYPGSAIHPLPAKRENMTDTQAQVSNLPLPSDDDSKEGLVG